MHTNNSIKEPDYSDLEYLSKKDFRKLTGNEPERSYRKPGRHSATQNSAKQEKQKQQGSYARLPTPVRVY